METWTSQSPHRPLHWYVGQELLWLTAATLRHVSYLDTEERRDYFLEEWLAAAEAWKVEPVAWVVLPNHWHAIVRPENPATIPRFVARVHGRTAIHLNRLDGIPGRRVWRQYWDTVLRTEGDFWSRVNYLWWNPVRHGCCEAPEDWRWTNLRSLLAEPAADVQVLLEQFPAAGWLPGDRW